VNNDETTLVLLALVVIATLARIILTRWEEKKRDKG